MIEQTFTVLNKMGLHARPAAMLVRILQKFESHVRIRKDDQEVDAKSIMGILTLTAEFGSKLTVLADGADEHQVIESLTDFFNTQVHEE
ncbi:MAG TPA: HPr family phosphocarrier protein [Elusimicrobiota bacterium]|nr:HPr family phosphocarrier protein [Elusimicrobiota bacterium]HMX43795.1 HPr family phosphocarrier protein [Elusimicrobiota bacterium]HMZ27724.1 HPr family phosphocarrier protein [Elusimicrobiota bacterium]HNA60671.1 HPr family phosphocarrier protein [Elusimicrobiota bacterium]HND64127.1 HPr family phosphocarrier protein [Elusimicrobiota bacterium]